MIAPGWRQARRVLLIRLDNLGDVLMTTPAMAAVRAALPQAQLTLLAAPAMQALKPHLPMVDDIVGFHAPWMKAGAAALQRVDDADHRGETERLMLWRLLGEGPLQRFDAAIIFTVCSQSVFPAATLCRLAGIERVLGHARERGYGLLSDEVHDTDVVEEGMRHEVRRQLDLVAHVGMVSEDDRLQFRLRHQDRRLARRTLRAAGVAEGRPLVLVHPGASAPSRRYPVEALGQAAELISHHGPCGRTTVALCAGPGEESLVEAMQRAMGGRGIVLPTPSSIGELAALIAEADVLVANNSGPVHLAAAVRTPVVDLYALTNPQHTPWRVPARVLSHDVPCRNCQKSVCPQGHHACLRGVSAEHVAAAAIALMPAAFSARLGQRSDTARGAVPSAKAAA